MAGKRPPVHLRLAQGKRDKLQRIKQELETREVIRDLKEYVVKNKLGKDAR